MARLKPCMAFDHIRIGRKSASIGIRLGTLCALLSAAMLHSQVHKVASQQKVVRSVAVYEWTGDLVKPTGARLIPISLFIDGRLEDGDVYRADPVPLALDTGNVYELQKAGLGQGTLDIAFARKLVPDTRIYTTWDDGWFGYGKFAPPEPPKKSNLRVSTTLSKVNAFDNPDDDKPHFSARSATPGSGGAATPAPGTTPTASSAPADDPDRPKLHKGSDSGSTVPDDPDRPTLRKHDKAQDDDGPSVVALVHATDDPDRPTLHRGKAAGALTEADLVKLMGLPADSELRQMVAVSDASDRPPHDFSRPWEDDAERAKILSKLQETAHAALTAYDATNAGVAQETKTAGTTAALSHPSAVAHGSTAKKSVPAPAPEALLDEKLTGYLLSYGGSPTFVYSAHTAGSGAALRFVTVVAQLSPQGLPEIALKSVTDATHLDRTPRMRLVDAVDAEASNRASLLFELRAQNSRQFALYRVIGGRSDQTFVSGATE